MQMFKYVHSLIKTTPLRLTLVGCKEKGGGFNQTDMYTNPQFNIF